MTTNGDDRTTTHAALSWVPEAFGNLGKKQYESALAMQRELLDTFERINHAWFARAQSEVDLAAEFLGKVADSRRMLADGEKLLRAGTRHLGNGATPIN